MSPLGEAMQSQVSPVSTTAGSSGDAADAAHKPSQRYWSICHDCDGENEMYPLVVYSIQPLTCHIITYIIICVYIYIYMHHYISKHFLARICPSWLAGRPKTAAECARNSQSDKSHQAPAWVEQWWSINAVKRTRLVVKCHVLHVSTMLSWFFEIVCALQCPISKVFWCDARAFKHEFQGQTSQSDA